MTEKLNNQNNNQNNKQENKQEEEFQGLNFDKVLEREERMFAARMRNYFDSLMDTYKPFKYKIDDIRRFLENPFAYQRQLREVSQYLMLASPKYMRLIFYFTTMPTLQWELIPPKNIEYSRDDRSLVLNYKRALDYLDNYNIKHEFKKILDTLLIEDVFFGYEVNQGKESFMIYKLPANYCRISGISGLFTFEFNMRYFDNKNKNLDDFPDDFKEYYKKYKRTKEEWQPMNTDKAVCFKFWQGFPYSVPPFVSLCEDLLDEKTIREQVKMSFMIENFKLLWQEIPFDDKSKTPKMLIDLGSIKKFHNNIKAQLPLGVNLVSTPMKLNELSFEKKHDDSKKDVEFLKDSFFDNAGVNSGVMNSDATGMAAINASIKSDEALVLSLLPQFTMHMNKRLSKITADGYNFRFNFLPITIYNQQEYFDRIIKSAQFGGATQGEVIAARGGNVAEVYRKADFEESFLGLSNKIKPLKSSHTGGNDDEPGRPEKDEDELTDEGESGKNEGKNDM